MKNVHPSNIHVANSSIFFVRRVFDGHCLSLGNIYIKYANEIKKGSVRVDAARLWISNDSLPSLEKAWLI